MKFNAITFWQRRCNTDLQSDADTHHRKAHKNLSDEVWYYTSIVIHELSYTLYILTNAPSFLTGEAGRGKGNSETGGAKCYKTDML